MLDIRKIVTIRDVTFSELGHKPAKPIVRAVGMAVNDNPYAGKHHDDLRRLWAGQRRAADAGARQDARRAAGFLRSRGDRRGRR